MTSSITTGNAKEDGRDFQFWFVGRLEEWCHQKNIPFDEGRFGLRNSSGIEIKWGIYNKGEERSQWAVCTAKTAMSILIRGGLVFHFRDPRQENPYREVRLQSQGDYVIWKENVLHTWRMEKDSVILTLRW
jgi:hypothetical protein